jgi:hypothetical protein
MKRVKLSNFKVIFMVNWIFLFFTCFFHQNSYLESYKNSSWATLRGFAGRMWPAGRTLPRPGLDLYPTLDLKLKFLMCALLVEFLKTPEINLF